MPEAEQPATPALIQRVDSFMYRVLDRAEDPVGVIEELKAALTELALMADSAGPAEALYPIMADLSDIADHYPVDYGEDAEMIARREIGDAARDWLRLPRTAGGVKSYVDRWAERVAALPATYRGRP
ncbi:hypothetical protein [Paractinoplanes maris]|uniref:hypothetical protein n=1 Tax=Paractinoplanes maris TaxID=1734446 RepID=UPI002022586B|nr:hypothetical protein [Actinoplanes maris]